MGNCISLKRFFSSPFVNEKQGITANSKEGTWDPVIDFVTLLPNDRRRYAFPCP
jgi:hypothetical protein